jgi:hypothetical protein
MSIISPGLKPLSGGVVNKMTSTLELVVDVFLSLAVAIDVPTIINIVNNKNSVALCITDLTK